MRGQAAATAIPAALPSPCKNLITDIFAEQYEQELAAQVDAELAAYAATATKLDAAIAAGEVDLKKITTA